MKKIISAISIVLTFTIISVASEYHVDKSKPNLVKFISDAPIENFEGITANINGYLFWEGENLLNQSQFYFEVDLNTLDTGIGLRNRHMRENYLETDKYPMASYEGKLVKADTISENEIRFTAEGTIKIHGKQKPLNLLGTIIRSQDNINVKTKFQVSLPDYDIEVPQLMFLKINEVMELVVDFNLLKVK